MISLEAKYPKKHINQWHNMPGSTPRRVIPRDSTSKEGSQPNKHLMHKETQYPEAEYPQGQYNTPNPGSQGLRLTIYSLHCAPSTLTLQMQLCRADRKKGWAVKRMRSCEIGSSCFDSEKLHRAEQSPVTGILKDTMGKKATFPRLRII